MVEGPALICSRKPKEVEKLRQVRSEIWKDRTLHGVDPKHLPQGDTQTQEDPAARHLAPGNNDLPGGPGEPLRPQ